MECEVCEVCQAYEAYEACEACKAYEACEACKACKWLIHPRIRRNIFTRGNSFECQMSESGSSVTEIGTLEECKN